MPVITVRCTPRTSTGTWTNLANAGDAGDGTFATWTDATRRGTTTVYMRPTDLHTMIPAGSTINSQTVRVRHFVSSAVNVETIVVAAQDTGVDYPTVALARPTAAAVSSAVVDNNAHPMWDTYEIYVTATRANNTTSSTWNLDWVEVDIDYTAASPPATAPTVTLGAATAQTIPLSWTAVTASPAPTYTIRNGGTVLASGITGTSHTLINQTPATAYSLTVEAVNSGGTGPPSPAQAITTLATYNMLPGLPDSATFEADTIHWPSQFGNATRSRVADAAAPDGANVASLVMTQADTAVAAIIDNSPLGLVPGQNYVLRFAGRGVTVVPTLRATIEWRTSAGALLSSTTVTAAGSTSAYTVASATAAAPATTANASLIVRFEATLAIGDEFRFDAVSLHEGTSNVYPGPVTAAPATVPASPTFGYRL